MPGLNITSEQFRTARQSIQSRYIKIELLNYQFQTVDSLEGKCTAGSITIDANSDIRRTGNITLIVNDSTFEVEPGGKIWLDKYLRIWVGVYSLMSREISWTNCGLYIIDAPSYQYDASNNILTLSLLDLMAKLTGVRNGYLKGLPVKFPAGEDIRGAIIATLELGGFTQYIVEEPPAPGKIPFDLEFGQGATVYELLKGLLDIYPDYEMFFDINGTFVYQKIPDGEGDPILVDDTLWQSVNASEGIAPDFQNVKNSIEVFGRTHDPAHFSIETTVEGSTIILSIPDVNVYTEDLIYGFTLTDNPGYTNMSLKVGDLDSYPILMDDGITPAIIEAEAGEIYYCVQFKGTYWNWLGHLQAYGFAEDTNPESPYYVEGTTGRIRLPLFGDVYDNIFSDDLARQRAEYELFLHSSMNDTVTLTCVPVYWLDVNILSRYTLARNNNTSEYIIKNISLGLAPTDTMTVTMIKFYPGASTIVERN